MRMLLSTKPERSRILSTAPGSSCRERSMPESSVLLPLGLVLATIVKAFLRNVQRAFIYSRPDLAAARRKKPHFVIYVFKKWRSNFSGFVSTIRQQAFNFAAVIHQFIKASLQWRDKSFQGISGIDLQLAIAKAVVAGY